MNLKRELFTAFFLLLTFCISAQNVEVKGVVKDEKGDPLFGVLILKKGTQQGAATDIDGKYSLQAQVGDVLEYTFLGMQTLSRKVTGNATINVVLKDDVQQLDEMVVTGYGTRKVASKTVASVAQVQGKEIAETPNASLADALQGRIAGMVVNTRGASGRPGSTGEILIHGFNNYQSLFKRNADDSYPLIIMDGIAVSESVFSNFNSSDIESITVLKDAASTSIYGSRAANGVILITTKRGRNNERTNITISHQLGFSALTSASSDFFDKMMTSEEYLNFWAAKDARSVRNAAGITGSTDADTRAAVEKILRENPYNTRWDKVFYRNFVPLTRTDVSVSGGTNSTSYYLSMGYFNQEGSLVPADSYKRYTLNGSIDTEITKWLKTGLSFSVGHSERESGGTQDQPRITTLPMLTPYDANGNEKEFIANPILKRTQYGFYHPNYYGKKHPSESYSDDFLPSIYVALTPIKNLTFQSRAGLQYSSGSSERKELPSFLIYKGPSTPILTDRPYTYNGSGRDLRKTITNTMEYRFLLGLHHSFDFLIGQESIENASQTLGVTTYGQPSDALSMLGHGIKNIKVEDDKSKSTFNSYFARLEYNYRNRYFLDLSARRDGSSSFGRDNRYANFWAIGAMWKLKQEAFLKDISWLTDLNLRFSTGISGNAGGGGYSHLTTIDPDTYYNGQMGYTVKNLGNPHLRWEEQGKTTIGLNVVIARATSFNIEYYNRSTYDMLTYRRTNTTSGSEQVYDNAGGMRNSGIDFTFSSVVYRSKDENWTIRPYFNMNYNKQELTALFGKKTSEATSSGIGYKLGSPLEFTAVLFKGINPQTGEIEYYKPGADRMEMRTDDNDVTTQYDSEKLIQTTGKKLQAPVNGGFGWNIAYKGFSLDMSFAFSLGRYMKNQDMYNTENPGRFGTANISKNALDYWKNPGDVTRHPKITSPAFIYYSDSRLIQKADFMRMKSVSLSYRLPKEVIDQVKFFSGIRIYGTARNIFTLTNYEGADPEFNASIAIGGYPPTRQFTMGVELNF